MDGATMQALLTAMVTWLSVNCGLPATYDLPQVRYAPLLEIAFLHHDAFSADAQRQVRAAYEAAPGRQKREVVSVYDARRRTIILPEGWEGRSPAELSMLLHELVHHLQSGAGLRYGCPQEREALAYEAQEKWLKQFGTTLEAEFDIDGLTLLVSTRCSM
jgi:hypothetical protein